MSAINSNNKRPISWDVLSDESVASSESIKYNPTENWILWTNRSYEPKRLKGMIRQMLRDSRSKIDSYFGY